MFFDKFKGRPYNAKPTRKWNDDSHWREYYTKLLSETDPWRREQVTFRRCHYLLTNIEEVGIVPTPDDAAARPRLLDAGCGITVLPHVFAHWGFDVTAMDLCGDAIAISKEHNPAPADLARCIPTLEPSGDGYSYRIIEDEQKSLARLNQFQRAGGSLAYVHADWHDAIEETFDVIHCRNSLRCSTKKYWRRSLQRFHELLKPGGVLLLETVNAIDIMAEAREVLRGAGFQRLDADTKRSAEHKYCLDLWPTG